MATANKMQTNQTWLTFSEAYAIMDTVKEESLVINSACKLPTMLNAFTEIALTKHPSLTDSEIKISFFNALQTSNER